MKPVVICDIDGTVSDDRWRRTLLTRDHLDTYHSLACEDEAATDVVEEALVCTDYNGAELYFISGRPERYREATAAWLHQHFGKLPFCLLMRAEGDHRPSPEMKAAMLRTHINADDVCGVFEDRTDILDAYAREGVRPHVMKLVDLDAEQDETAATILAAGAKTYAERNEVYGDNWRNFAPVMRALFPDGVPQELIFSDKWNLFEMVVGKLTRFANSKLTHRDSIHDAMVYAAMVENCLREEEQNG